MTNTITVVCPLPPKELSPNARCHWRVKHRHSSEYRRACRLATRAAEMSLRKYDLSGVDWSHARLQATFFYPDRRRRDRDNSAAMLKYAYDGIAEALGVDDYGFRPQMPEVEVDKEDPRVEIVVVGDVV
jgi:crossover junction endodeoxyribonuclease RusA